MKHAIVPRGGIVTALAALFVTACVIKEAPPPTTQQQPGVAQAQPTAAQPTAAPQPTYAPTTAPTPTPTAAPTPTVPSLPAGIPTTLPTSIPGIPGLPGSGTPTGGTAGGLTLPGVCVPIGTWTKKFDNGLPASGSVTISAPVIFNQFPVQDNVVVATMPAGNLKGTGAMTSTNDLSIDVTSAGYVLSYTCKFSGTNCNEGTCTVTKGGLGGFKLLKQ